MGGKCLAAALVTLLNSLSIVVPKQTIANCQPKHWNCRVPLGPNRSRHRRVEPQFGGPGRIARGSRRRGRYDWLRMIQVEPCVVIVLPQLKEENALNLKLQKVGALRNWKAASGLILIRAAGWPFLYRHEDN